MSLLRNKLTLRNIAIGFALFLIFIIIIANLGRGAIFYQLISILPGGDKGGHFLLFGIMSFLLNGVLNCRSIAIRGFKIMQGSFFLILIATLEEFSQYFIPSRTFEMLDLYCSYAGIIGFGWLSLKLLRVEQKKKT